MSFANCGLPYHISGTIDKRDIFITNSRIFKERYNLDVRVFSEVLSINTTEKKNG